MSDEKIQKVLARAGLGSRREIERWLSDGRIDINEQRAKLGDRMTRRDVIKVDGKVVKLDTAFERTRRVLVYNKPIGEVVATKDPQGRPTVFANLPRIKGERWIAIGRLDINTSGLLLFTTDGELAARLMHPKYQIEREYAVRVLGNVDKHMVERLHKGVELEDGPARFTDIQQFSDKGANQWYHVVIMEGRNREVRRLWQSQGVTVSRLKRVRYGNIFMDSDVKTGQFKLLEKKECDTLAALVELDKAKVPVLAGKEKENYDRARRRHQRQKGVNSK